MQRHSMAEIVNHSRNTALERPVRILLGGGLVLGGGGGLNRFYVITTLALVLPWFTQGIFQSA